MARAGAALTTCVGWPRFSDVEGLGTDMCCDPHWGGTCPEIQVTTGMAMHLTGWIEPVGEGDCADVDVECRVAARASVYDMSWTCDGQLEELNVAPPVRRLTKAFDIDLVASGAETPLDVVTQCIRSTH